MPQDPESHWAVRGLIGWLRFWGQGQRWSRTISVIGVVSLVMNVVLLTLLLGSRQITRTPTVGESCPVGSPNVPGGADPWGGCFPGPGNTGVPVGTTLTTYSGGDTISTAVNITAKTVNDPLLVVSGGSLTVVNSELIGGVEVEAGGSLSITDSYATGTDPNFRVLGVDNDASLTLVRSEVDGGTASSAGWCSNCVLTDNWLHNESVLPDESEAHVSGWRMRQHGIYTHNSIGCNVDVTPADGGCSASLTGYGDFEPVIDNLLENNLILSHHGSAFCVYGGSSPSKPFSDDAEDIRFVDNIFQKGTGWGINEGPCADFGPVSGWNGSEPGNVWSNNLYDDGTTVVPDF